MKVERVSYKAHVLDPGDVIYESDTETVEIAEVTIVAKTIEGRELRFKPDDVLEFERMSLDGDGK